MGKLSERKHKLGKSKKTWRKTESRKSVEKTDSRCSSGERPMYCGFLASQSSKCMQPLREENWGTN